MEAATTKQVLFDVLVKGRLADSPRTPGLETIEELEPAPEQIESCRRRLTAEGVTCHPTDFGLACSAPVELFERLFQVKLEKVDPTPGRAPYALSGEPLPPDPIAEQVDQITLTVAPELF